MTDHLNAWRDYATARIEHEQAVVFAKEVSARFRKAEAILLDALIDDEVTGISDATGAKVGLSRQWSIKCNVDNKEDVEAWMQDRYGDVEPFRTIVLDKAAIVAQIRDDCEDDDKELTEDQLPEFFGLNTRPQVVVRGWKFKKEAMAK